MKRTVSLLSVVALGTLLAAPKAFAQITLTEPDVLAWFTQSTTLHWEFATASPMDVGTPGAAAQTFDFSTLQFGDNSDEYITYFTLANSPGDTSWPHARDFAGIFRSAPYAAYDYSLIGVGYSYYHLNDSGLFEDGGISTVLTTGGVAESIDTELVTPMEPELEFPLTYGSQWVYVTGPDTSYSTISLDTTVFICDAFGTLRINTGNGPVDYDCLRITQTETTITFDTSDTSPKDRSRFFVASHQYVTKEGIQLNVEIDSSDLSKSNVTPSSVSAYFNPVPASGVVSAGEPGTLGMVQNYPNPFATSTSIEYSLPRTEFVTIELYNALGECVARPVNDAEGAGNHTIVFNAHGLPDGIYFCRMNAGTDSEWSQMTVVH